MSQPYFSSDFWNFGAEKESRIHRIHSYPAKFPSFITTKALQYAEGKGLEVNTVADVFCGCGTTAVEAKRNGKKFWGCDINPVATLIAQVKIRQYHAAKLDKYFMSIVKTFNSTKIKKNDFDNINDRIKYWYNEEQIESLLKLKKAIEKNISNRSSYRKFFLCAFSNILKPTSKWLTKSIKPQIDPHKSPIDVMEAFGKQFRLMKKANEENSFPKAKSSDFQIMQRNFLSLKTSEYKADIIITSPPYVSSYDYADIHQLSTLWLGLCSDYRDIRTNMMGNTYKIETPSVEDIESLPSIGRKIYSKLLCTDKSKSKSTARYFIDIKKSVENCYEVLNKNGITVFVIGNTNYRSVEIDNATFMLECMKRAGFLEIQKISRRISLKMLTPFRDSKGRFTKSADHKEVYKYEFVIVGTKK